MAPIYTTQFYVGQPTAGSLTTIYTVQPGMVAVLRDVELGAGASGDGIFIYAAGASVIILYPTAAGPYFHGQWQGRVALGAGNSFQLRNLGADTVSVACSGYVFRA